MSEDPGRDLPARRGATVALTAPEAVRLGETLRERAAQLGLTQKDLAEAAGLNRGHVARLQAGEIYAPQLVTLTRLARALHWPYGHALAVARGTAEPEITFAEPGAAEPATTDVSVGDEWMVLLGRVQSRSIVTQRVLLAVATALLDELPNGGNH